MDRPTEAFADAKIGPAVRTLRTNFLAPVDNDPVKVVAVSSPMTAEGKTTVAALFAESLASLGTRVLLVDADLRNPSIAKTYLPGSLPETSRGTSEVLRDEAELGDFVRPAWAEGLSLLATSPDAEVGDLLARGFERLVDDARRAYDFVIVDTPPLLATDEARTVAAAVDAVLLVVRVGSLDDSVRKAVEALRTLQVRVVGIVANSPPRAQGPAPRPRGWAPQDEPIVPDVRVPPASTRRRVRANRSRTTSR
jgi:capsular exopolysaccharide synthesis family protein